MAIHLHRLTLDIGRRLGRVTTLHLRPEAIARVAITNRSGYPSKPYGQIMFIALEMLQKHRAYVNILHIHVLFSNYNFYIYILFISIVIRKSYLQHEFDGWICCSSMCT